MKITDTTGLSSFSFDELYAKIGGDPILLAGPRAVLEQKEEGMSRLIEVLKWLPELSLAIDFGSGSMSVESVARVVQGWIDGKSIPELSNEFPGDSTGEKVRNAAIYIFRKVSQTISWEAHAYLRGWDIRHKAETPQLPNDRMLGAYIQYGVGSPEAAVASLLGVPRQLAEAFAIEYREQHGDLTPATTPIFKNFIENAESSTWEKVTSRSSISGKVAPEDTSIEMLVLALKTKPVPA